MVFPGNTGKITGNATLLAEFTAEVNIAHDHALRIIYRNAVAGRYNDSNHSGSPEILINILAGTREYSVLNDGSSNLAIDIHNVFLLPSATATTYVELEVAEIYGEDTLDFLNGSTTQGVPTRYARRGTKIVLDLPPSYSVNSGLKVPVTIEPSYFITSDTTKKPGFSGLFHEYLALRPAYIYASNNSLPVSSALYERMARMESEIEQFYAIRDTQAIMVPEPVIYE
jgi:hypothetical protein